MTTVLVKKYQLIDGLNGRTIDVDEDDIGWVLGRLRGDVALGLEFADAVKTRGVPYWSAKAQATLRANPAFVDETETTQIAPTVGAR